MAPTLEALIGFIEELDGRPLARDGGLKFGRPQEPLRSILVCWMATVDALETAGQKGCDLVLTHESVFYPYNATDKTDNPPGWEDWPTNRLRREVMERYNLAVMRAHVALDRICIHQAFVQMLQLDEPVRGEGFSAAYDIEPCSLAELVERVKQQTGLSAVRVSCPQGMGQMVRRVGLAWGGTGLFVNVTHQQSLIELGCDVLIGGESDEYGFLFAAECGIPHIETGHSVSENPGLERFCPMLRERFPDLTVHYYECPPAWEIY